MQLNVGGKHENSPGADFRNRSIGQPEAFESRIANQLPAFIVDFLEVLDNRFEQFTDRGQFLPGEVRKVTNLAEDMRRRDQSAEPCDQPHEQIVVFDVEIFRAFEIQNPPLLTEPTR